jgi:spoIIIJ-associated protein
MGKKVKIRASVKSTDSIAAAAKQTLSRLLELMRVEAVVEVKDSGISGEESVTFVNLETIGDGSGLLIGKHGATLDAIQHITNKMINRRFSGGCNIRVDSENYRAKREESLTQLAKRLGEKAKKIRKPVSLNPLSARDRKTIHMALKEDRDVQTRSSGTGILKRVVIFPSRQTAAGSPD